MESWASLFLALDQRERVRMMELWAEAAAREKNERKRLDWHLGELARLMGMRPVWVRRQPREKQLQWLAERAHGVIVSPDLWHELFVRFYAAERRALMGDFLDALGIPHENGMIRENPPGHPDVPALIRAMNVIHERHPENQVRHYLRTLIRIDADEARSGVPEEDRLWAKLAEAWMQWEQLAESQEGHRTQDVIKDDTLRNDGAMPKAWGFTTLDEVIIHQIVATAAEEEGALSPEKLDDLIEETIALNHHRAHSYFHRGFADVVVWGRDPNLSRPELNDLRKAWLVTGALAGWARKQDWDGFRSLWNSERTLFRIVMDEPRNVELKATIAQHLYPPLAQLGEHYEAAFFLGWKLRARPHFADFFRGLALATDLLRADEPEAAFAYLQVLDRYGARFWQDAPVLEIRLRRRIAQARMRMGQFREAERILQSLLELHGEEQIEAEGVAADLALARTGRRWIGDVLLPEEKTRRHELHRDLARSRDLLEAHADNGHPNVHYLLAVLGYLDFSENGNEAALRSAGEHARRAIAHMHGEAAPVYRRAGLFGTAHFIELCALAHTAEEDRPYFLESKWSKWESFVEDASRLPTRDLALLLEGVALHDPAVAARMAQALLEGMDTNRAWKVLHKSNVLADLLTRGGDALLTATLAHVQDERIPRTERFARAQALVEGAARRAVADSIGQRIAAEALDAMENMALRDEKLAREMIRLLESERLHETIWDDEDALWCRLRLLRRLGDDAAAAEVLRQLFYACRDRSRFEAEEVLALARAWNLDVANELARGMPAGPEKSSGPSVTVPLYILFVGGNEIQQRYDDRLRQWVQEQYPQVRLEIIHPHWSSNWGRQIDDLRGRIEQADVVVIMRMVRTHLGRQLRRLSRCWVPCTGTGYESLRRSVEEAIHVGATQKSRRQ